MTSPATIAIGAFTALFPALMSPPKSAGGFVIFADSGLFAPDSPTIP